MAEPHSEALVLFGATGGAKDWYVRSRHGHEDVVRHIPDGRNLFQRSSVSIAMGNASPDVHYAATFVMTSNTEDGFARAMERFVLRAQTT